MESTFVLKNEDLNDDFLESVKKLFKNAKQLQITITTSDDFGLTTPEHPSVFMERLTRAKDDADNNRNVVQISEAEFDEMVLSRLQ